MERVYTQLFIFFLAREIANENLILYPLLLSYPTTVFIHVSGLNNISLILDK